MSTVISPNISSTLTQEAESYARNLQAFCRDDSVQQQRLNRSPGLVRFFLRKPTKFVHGPCVVINRVAGVMGLMDVSGRTAAYIASALGEQVRGLLSLHGGDGSMEYVIERIIGTMLEKCIEIAPTVEVTTAKQIEEFNPKGTRNRINDGIMNDDRPAETYSIELQELRNEFENAVLTRRHIIAVTSTLQILLDHTARIVDRAVKEIPDAECATTCAWGFSTLVTGAAFVASFTPAFAALQLGVPARLAIRYFSGALGIVSGGKVVQKGRHLNEVRKECKNLEINLDHLDKRTKAFCSFIGYIFQHMMALEHLSSEQYIQLVRELNKTLPTDVGDWSNLEYVTRFVNKDMEYLNSRVSEVMGGLNRLGIVAEPKFET